MVRLVLVRHGQTVSNVAGLLDTAAPGASLTDLGRSQAATLADRLAHEPVERIVVSNLVRTGETAAPLAAATALEPVQDDRLREVSAGDLELRDDRAAHRTYLGTVLAWAAGELDARIPGSAEDGHDFFARVDAAVADAIDGVDGVVVCVSHGAAIRSWASARAENLPSDWGGEHGLPNTGAVVLEPSGTLWRVLEWEGERFGDPDRDPTGAPVGR